MLHWNYRWSSAEFCHIIAVIEHLTILIDITMNRVWGQIVLKQKNFRVARISQGITLGLSVIQSRSRVSECWGTILFWCVNASFPAAQGWQHHTLPCMVITASSHIAVSIFYQRALYNTKRKKKKGCASGCCICFRFLCWVLCELTLLE